MKKIDDDELLEMMKAGNMTQKQMAEHFNCSEPAITNRKKKFKKLGMLVDVPESFKNLSDKEQKYVVARLEGKNQTQSALESHDCENSGSARSMGSQLAKKPDIQLAIQDIMQEQGLTRRYRIKKLKEHIDNKDPHVSLKGLDQSWKLDGSYNEEPPPQPIDIKILNINIHERAKTHKGT